ncbi:enoyl-[acyl-carrier-protein] reductase, mitochondrial-like [Palaemon carinicauda]|uniref:enoyl-[acyl-carrier-protein] reductase, mitochondrial-like n=1 Tax=Palaemon carinicauda TaxID=392227 RepID=UPI0035B64A7A
MLPVYRGVRRSLNVVYLSQVVKRSASGLCSSLTYDEYGDPEKVIKLKEEVIPKPEGKQVLVRMLAATVNPADINTIQGVYAIKPPLPSIPGNEGVGEVIEVGSDVEGDIKPGCRVIPRLNAWGTWRTHALADYGDLIKIPSDIDLAMAATIAVNPGTAYRMLKDFVPLSTGDVVIQNGANSAVGQAVIQIASALGLRTVNVVRDRPGIDELKQKLKDIGATVVVTEGQLRKSEEVNSLPKPSLALNCVSGRSGTEVLRQLSSNGVMVTYGGMSRQPVTVPVGSLIFTNVSLKGFWMTRWNKEHYDHPKRQQMLNDLFELVSHNKLKPPEYSYVPLENYLEAIRNAMPKDGMLSKKQILVFGNGK